jgi:hypothetical protein
MGVRTPGLGLRFVAIRNHQARRAFLREAAHQRRADAAGPAGHQDDLALQLHQATSNSPAAPCPPPMHMVTTTYFAPRRLPSISA